MDYFKLNYYKLANIKLFGFYKVIIMILLLLIILIILACNITTYHKVNLYGFYKDNIIHFKINNKLSDAVSKNEYITFNKERIKYKDLSYGDYEIIGNDIYQDVYLTIDKNLYENEVGLITIYYHKEKIIEYIFELFK